MAHLEQKRKEKAAEPKTEEQKAQDREQMKRVGHEIAGAVMYGKQV
eukprot:CAMPEP_0201581584 /NCGR_PEP_ID=MMETSP0190_2-20130828/71632_1 /ASSEMBLY_ACC=CAM_ASM_000263 /TAXON_ID=37353 /ORGANISM="Rosalina sp." /LENGTH=45 /DNA_ID= /DNA_START= /DNA_END= /DNA_ORIENTATION=